MSQSFHRVDQIAEEIFVVPGRRTVVVKREGPEGLYVLPCSCSIRTRLVSSIRLHALKCNYFKDRAWPYPVQEEEIEANTPLPNMEGMEGNTRNGRDTSAISVAHQNSFGAVQESSPCSARLRSKHDKRSEIITGDKGNNAGADGDECDESDFPLSSSSSSNGSDDEVAQLIRPAVQVATPAQQVLFSGRPTVAASSNTHDADSTPSSKCSWCLWTGSSADYDVHATDACWKPIRLSYTSSSCEYIQVARFWMKLIAELCVCTGLCSSYSQLRSSATSRHGTCSPCMRSRVVTVHIRFDCARKIMHRVRE